jgi:YggT family protein
VSAFLVNFLELLVVALWLMILGRVIISFVDPMGRQPLSSFLIGMTEPILAPVRRLLPSTGMVDFSPLIVMLLLSAVAGVRFTVHLTPRGGGNRVDGVAGGALRARVASAPVDGGANRALLRLLANELDLPARSIRLVTGAAGRRKVVEVDGVDAVALRTRWPGLAV